MSEQPTTSSKRRLATTMRLSRWLRRATIPIGFAAVIYFWQNYGSLSVPSIMDTMPETHPPGTLCFVEKWPRRVAAGSVVFVDVPAVGTLLTRVDRVEGDAIFIEHDNDGSGFPDGYALGPVPMSAVRALVLTQFNDSP